MNVDIFTAILLSIVSLLLGICSTYAGTKIKNHLDAQKKLKDEHDMLIAKYQDDTKRLLVAFSHLGNRLSDINEQSQSIESLKIMPSKNDTIEWYTKEGYYITSTAWLLAKISCLINQYQEETKCIGCRQSESNELGRLLEGYQYQIKSCGLLWFYYHIAIGEAVYDEKRNKPMSFYDFSTRLSQDSFFFDYMDQTFHFIRLLISSNDKTFVTIVLDKTNQIRTYLEELIPINKDVPADILID